MPDEAIEAAAKAIYPHTRSAFDETYEHIRERCRKQARAALEAAAPYIRAQALDDAADKLGEDTRPTPQLYAQWLRIRAVAERGGA